MNLVDMLIKDPINQSDAKGLFNEFLNHPKLTWTASNSGCEARADMMAEIAESKGYDVGKIWVHPSSSTDTFQVYLNHANTESTVWNYHVAIMIKIKEGNGESIYVMDPSFFDKPVKINEWVDQVSRLNDQYDSRLTFTESGTKPFYGPHDHVTPELRREYIQKRDEILANASNLNDEIVLDGVLSKKRGQYIDDLFYNQPDQFADFERLFQNPNFSLWFGNPENSQKLKSALNSSSKYFNIDSSTIKSNINLNDPLASYELKKRYWKEIGEFFGKLKKRSVELNNGTSDQAIGFKIDWEDREFQQKWFSPMGQDLWRQYGVEF